MENKEILERVLACLNERFPNDGTPLNASTQLSETVLLDSFTVLQVIMSLEEDFGISFDRSDLDYLDTPANIAELIISKQSGGQ